MNLHAIAFILGAAASFSFIGQTAAQTCRVNTGKQTNGCVVYTEVFEYDYVDQKPEFPGSCQSMLNFINDTRKYPEEAYLNGIEGRVLCSFVVNPDGSLEHITVLRGVEPSLNQEAVRVISCMPPWKPGKIKDRPVPVRVVCTIPFRK